MNIDYTRGSEWRKWDLHLHTPSSYDYHDMSVDNKEIIGMLVENNISLVAITDHHNIDVDRIKELQELGKGKITILPGIELRSELGGSESIHFIGIFPEDADIKNIWISLQGKCDLFPEKVKSTGEDKFYCDFKDTAMLIKRLGGIVTVHAGGKSNTIENISNSWPHKMAQKADLAKESIDIYEIGRVNDQDVYNKVVFPSIKKVLPMVMGSDNHNIKNYTVKENCWIKADPTFYGLKQLINEPKERVYIGGLPPKLKLVSSNRSKFIDSIKIRKIEGSTLKQQWFDNEIKLNNDLVAVIGNKGSGKSALTDIIGLVGCCKNERYFSFLNDKRFKRAPHNFSSQFEARLYWCDNSPNKKLLSDSIKSSEVEQVKYLPQQYLEKICNELGDDFEKEINYMVFSYLPEEERLDKHSFESLMEYLCSATDSKISSLQNSLREANKRIIELETKEAPQSKDEIVSSFKLKWKELRNHLRSRPKIVEEPKRNEEMKSKIAILDEQINSIEKDIVEKQLHLNSVSKTISDIELIRETLLDFERKYEHLIKDIEQRISEHCLEIELNVKFSYDKEAIKNRLISLEKVKNKLKEVLEQDKTKWLDNSLFKKKLEILFEKSVLENQMDNEFKDYQNYLSSLNEWKQRKREIIGSKDKVNSLIYYLSQLRYLKEELLTDKAIVLAERKKICREIYQLKLEKANKYKEKYKYIIDFLDNYIEENKMNSEDNLRFSVEIFPNRDFIEDFLYFIKQNITSIFKGVREGQNKLKEIISKYDFNKESGILGFVDEVYNEITKDLGKVDSLIKNRLEFYDLLFSLNYLKIEYRLNLGDKSLEQLSPGEKGALLLIYYLVLDKDNNPLIIDQPEDNLDNQSVYEKLVPYIRQAKKRRQVIIVTHNPNIAVACDAEQIIYCNMDKRDWKVEYISGSIENSLINKCIVDVLEGTMPAFTLRKLKYS